jgi:quinol monooxygenase YgiN
MVRCLRLLAVALTFVPAAANAQTYVATYVELLPSAVGEGSARLKRYRDASRKDTGNLRMELVQEAGRPTRFALLAIWADAPAFEAHRQAAHTAQLRESLKASLAAPHDERVHSGMSVGARDGLRSGSVVVVTHVDVPGTYKDATVPLLHELGDASRKEPGNLRFEVQQQGNRPNHFTVVESWADQKSYEAHVAAGHTRHFRDKLGPMTGALYDERLYRAVD